MSTFYDRVTGYDEEDDDDWVEECGSAYSSDTSDRGTRRALWILQAKVEAHRRDEIGSTSTHQLDFF